MKEGKGNTVLLTIIGIATLLIAVVGATFAYFTAVLSGQESEATVSISSGTIGTHFEGGPLINAEDIYPRGNAASLTDADAWATKTFSVSGSVTEGGTINYSLALQIDSNSFVSGESASALGFTLTGSNNSSNGTLATDKTYTDIPVTGSVSLGSGIIVGPSNFCSNSAYTTEEACTTGGGTWTDVTHTYVLKIYFPDTGVNQNENQKQAFTAHVVVSESR